MTAVSLALSDGWVVARRNLIKLKRVPDLLAFNLVQPIMFVVLFAYLFGGSINIPGVSYREYMMAGIFVQTVAFGSSFTAIGLADDLQKGIIDRFRSLPMSRAAVLVGRTTSDLMNTALSVLVMSICGLLVGWRIRDGFFEAVAAYALLFLWAYAMIWVSATIGLLVRTVEVAQSFGFIWMFPLTMLSNAYIATDTLPRPLQVFADWNPVSSVSLSMRDLFGNAPEGLARGDGFPAEHPIVLSLIWCAAILLVFVPLSISRYRKAATR